MESAKKYGIMILLVIATLYVLATMVSPKTSAKLGLTKPVV
jgi:hypothetical protein